MSQITRPLPVPSPESAPFWEGCRRHELLMQRCGRCGHLSFPPASRCHACLASDLAWVRASGRGKVHSFVVYRRAYHPAFEQELPYIVALVELEEGPRLISNLIGCDPESARCDMPVEVVFDDLNEMTTLYRFRPASERSPS